MSPKPNPNLYSDESKRHHEREILSIQNDTSFHEIHIFIGSYNGSFCLNFIFFDTKM